MNTKTIVIIAVIVVIALGVVWYANSHTGSQSSTQTPGANSENAPDLTTSDSVFNEIDNTADSLE